METIVKMIFGSHLYGLDTPKSDMDYKGVFMPSYNKILLGRIQKNVTTSTGKDHSKNTTVDVDLEFFSLHYFIELACQGQTVALDMLHAPDDMIIETSPIWKHLVQLRHLFYTKNLSAFIGYARRQASKYGIKGSRLNSVRMVLEHLEILDSFTKLRDIWDALPTGEHIHFLDPNPLDTNKFRIYQVVGKKFLESVKIEDVYNALSKFEKDYGARAKLAAENKGIDWKAISHALRAAYQVKELLTDGTITFPLKDAEYLKQVKLGQLDYLTEVNIVLENLMDEVEQLATLSSLPAKVNRAYWDDTLLYFVKEYYK